MTTKVSLKGYVTSTVEKELILTNLDPTVERNLSKDLITIPYPAADVESSGYGIDLGFDEDIFTLTFKLVNTIVDSSSNEYTPKQASDYIWYMVKIATQDDPLTFYYDGSTYNVMPKACNMAQQASWGAKRTMRIQLQIVTN